jgi:hypothetical protein
MHGIYLIQSSPPIHYDKKSKITISPDRQVIWNWNLETDDLNTNATTTPPNSFTSNLVNQPHLVHNDDDPAPPIYLKSIFQYALFNNLLRKLTSSDCFTCNSTHSYHIVQPSGRITFNKIVNHLNEIDASFNLFKPHKFRS